MCDIGDTYKGWYIKTVAFDADTPQAIFHHIHKKCKSSQGFSKTAPNETSVLR
jgi:hypothetical protein